MFVNLLDRGVNLNHVQMYEVKEGGLLRLWFNGKSHYDVAVPESDRVLSALRASAAKEEPEPWEPAEGSLFIG